MALYTNQEIFDKVAVHLFTQKVRSERDGFCCYRGIRGMKCAVGALIPDDKYDPEMDFDSLDVAGLIEKFPIFESIFDQSQVDILLRLQQIHDGYMPMNPDDFTDGIVRVLYVRLKEAALDYSLNTSVLEEIYKPYRKD